MQLREAMKEYEKGERKGIRRAKWHGSMWVKPNDYGVIDEMHFQHDGGQGVRGYTPNLDDFFADDWELMR
jgi:hypothetical protein